MAEGQSNLRGNPCRPSLRLTKPTYVLIASIGRALPTRGLIEVREHVRLVFPAIE